MKATRDVARDVARLALVAAALLTGACSRESSAAGSVEQPVADSVVIAAEAALAAGRPWHATQLLAPRLAADSTRTPLVVLLAARAASEWQGWSEVRQLLASAPWLDTLFAGEGHVLLARAALATAGGDSTTVRHTRAALLHAPDDATRGPRLVLHARAHERLDARDSARLAYLGAADRLAPAADWLRLRAALLTPDSAARQALYDRLTSAAAQSRAPWSEATARDRWGDFQGAARRYAALDAPVAAIRAHLAAGPDDSVRAALRDSLLALIETRRGADARDAIVLLDESFAPLKPSEQLTVARSAARSGPLARAATAYAAAFRARLGSSSDRYSYGIVLSSLRRDGEAVRQFANAMAAPAIAPSAAYRRARSLLRSGSGSRARDALRSVARTYARDTSAAASALFLLADLATDEQRDGPARATFVSLASRYPTSGLAAPAIFRAAIIAFVSDSARAAARELDTLVERYPRDEEVNAALYWSGRAWAKAGDTARARERWRQMLTREPRSYYAMLSARRLGEPYPPPSALQPLGDTVPHVPAVDSAMTRAALLTQLDMTSEARQEYEWLERTSERSRERQLATAFAFAERGLASRAITLGRRALASGAARDSAVDRLIYPLAYQRALAAEAERRKLDLALIAALIRQESSFTPEATSPAGARGLMQVMPEVGRRIAQSLDYPIWNSALLYQPDVNIQLGTTHLVTLVRQYGPIEHVLAAYNAGGSRVARWREKRGADDPEIFVERIPFQETRDYVRIVLRNREFYRALYSL